MSFQEWEQEQVAEPDVVPTPPIGRRPGSHSMRWSKMFPQQLKSALGITGICIMAAWVLVAVLAPVLAPYDPLLPGFPRLQAPSASHLFGTDAVGRDVLSRVIFGARVSIPIAGLVVAVSLVVGGVTGMVAAYFSRIADESLMRLADLFFAFPPIILALVISASLGPSLLNAALSLVIVSWPNFARVSRSLVISLKNSEYVMSARLLGGGPVRVLVRDVLPNVRSPLLILATLSYGHAILLLSGLSFLGLGVIPPTPSWGGMVSAGVSQFSSWWISVFAGIAIFMVVAGVNMIGDALRDSLDPQTARTVAA